MVEKRTVYIAAISNALLVPSLFTNKHTIPRLGWQQCSKMDEGAPPSPIGEDLTNSNHDSEVLAGKATPGSPEAHSRLQFTPQSTLNRLMDLEKREIAVKDEISRNFKRVMSEKKIAENQRLREDLASLKKGCKLLKIPHRGQPKSTTFYITTNDNGDYICYWSSKTKSRLQCTFVLQNCGLYLGQGQGLFKKRNLTMEPGNEGAKPAAHSRLSFSLVTEKRTVDLMALDSECFERILRVLKYVGVELRTYVCHCSAFELLV